MVSLGQVDELEVEGEGAAQLVCLVYRHGVCTQDRLLQQDFGLCQRALRHGFASADRREPQLLHFFKEHVASLLAQDLAQQHAERANVSAQWRFFQISRARLKFGEAFGPAVGLP